MAFMTTSPAPGRRRVRGTVAIVIALVLGGRALAFAQPSPPLLTAPVNDFANVIDAKSEQELERRIRALQAASGTAVVVATVPTFQPYGSIDEYAVKMFENGGRGIGEKGKDGGALIVVAVEDRRVRIEVGYGLEGYITDGYAGQTIRELMLPAFRNGQYGQGLLAGTTRVINRIATEQGVTLQDVPQSAPAQVRRGGRNRQNGSALVIFIFIILIVLMNSRGGRRRRRWGGGPWSGWNSGVGPFGTGMGGFGGGFGGFGGGGGGGGFGGFGGGRSGGGGASGGW
jgi:uncharacterized protein